MITYSIYDSGNQEFVYPLFTTTLAATGFAYQDRFIVPIVLDKLFIPCENSHIAAVPQYGLLPPYQEGDEINYQKERIVRFDEIKFRDPCPGILSQKF